MLYDYTRQIAQSTRDSLDRVRVYADIGRLEKATAEAEQRIKEAETMLHTTLPLEATRLGANLEWLRLPGMAQ